MHISYRNFRRFQQEGLWIYSISFILLIKHSLPNYIYLSNFVRGEKKNVAPNCITIWKAEIRGAKKHIAA